jgi:hypothetical protein
VKSDGISGSIPALYDRMEKPYKNALAFFPYPFPGCLLKSTTYRGTFNA